MTRCGSPATRIGLIGAIIEPSSGGPVFDARGKVIAVTVAHLKDGQNLNLAIPVGYVRELADDLHPMFPEAFAKATIKSAQSARCTEDDPTGCESLCDRGYTGPCVDLGWMHAEGRGVVRDPQRAAALYRKACDAANFHGCSRLGTLYEAGFGVVTDAQKARSLYARACDLGGSYGCSNLAELALVGKGMRRDARKALSLFAKSCDFGNVKACRKLGVLYEEGRDAPRDAARAVTYYQRACDGHVTEACTRLANLVAARRHDDVRASALFSRACEAGDRDACAIYNRRLYDGRGLPAQREQALGRMKRLCDAQVPLACEYMKELEAKGARRASS